MVEGIGAVEAAPWAQQDRFSRGRPGAEAVVGEPGPANRLLADAQRDAAQLRHLEGRQTMSHCKRGRPLGELLLGLNKGTCMGRARIDEMRSGPDRSAGQDQNGGWSEASPPSAPHGSSPAAPCEREIL